MLAFDIETTGLNPRDSVVTCACAFDPDAGIDRIFFFGYDGSSEDADTPEVFFALLDRADRLCAFNGVRFDLPFLQARYGLSDSRIGAWVLKLCDLYEAGRLGFGSAYSLNALLAANGLDAKTGCGADAILLAREGRWRELGEYCRQDTIKTHSVSGLSRVLLPFKMGRAVHMVGGRFIMPS
jgi:hypothetical protein